jgi:hypothetical protein
MEYQPMKIRLLRVAVITMMTVFLSIIVVVVVIAQTRRSGRAGMDATEMQRARTQVAAQEIDAPSDSSIE